MKVIDLLNKIANGEIDYTTKFDAKVNMGYCGINEYFERYPINENYLNCEIELEYTPKEDKKIERIDCWYQYDNINDKILTKIMLDELKDKINEIIDRLNGDTNE